MPSSPSPDTPAGMGLDSDGFAFVARVPVRWSDMDAFGHINHARMVTLMEEARIEWLMAARNAGASADDVAALIMSAMIVHVEIRYQRQLRHDDTPLRVGMWISSHRSVDFTIGYEIRATGDDATAKAACVASTQMAVVDAEAHTLRRLSPAEKGHLRSWMRPQDGS